MVEERQRAPHVALVAQRDVACLGLGLLAQYRVEIAEQGQPALVRAACVRKFHASGDDGLVRLGQSLAALGHRRRGERQERVDLEGHLGRRRLVRHVGQVEGVQVRARIRCEAYRLPSVSGDDGAVLSGRVEDDDLVLGIGQDGVLYLALDAEGLAGSRLARHESHGAREVLAVAQHQVAALLVLPVVSAAILGELLGGEGHLDGDLGGRHHAGHLHVVVSERQHRVHALALAVVERPDLDRVAPAGGDDLQHLVVEFLARRRPGEHEARVYEEPLVLVLQVVEQVFRLFF